MIRILVSVFLISLVSARSDSCESCSECGSQFKPFLWGVGTGLLGASFLVYSWMKDQSTKQLKSTQLVKRSKDAEKYASREKTLWPMDSVKFRKYMNELVDLIIEYAHDPQKYNVLTDKKFGFLYSTFPRLAPQKGQTFEAISKDIHEVLLPGLLHWQHPRFHGYFGSGFSYPDILADTFISGIAVIPFAWIGAPAIAELEMVVLNWFGQAIGLNPEMLFAEDVKKTRGGGIISSSSSEIIYVSMMVSRNKKLRELVDYKDPDHRRKEAGYLSKLVAYTNIEAHSAIEKACNMAMIRLRAIKPNTSDFGLTGAQLEKVIKKDIANGFIPFHIHGSLGTTNSVAIDRLEELSDVAKRYNCWIHVDAAYGGCPMICPEFRHLGKGIENLDSINLNLHKWPFCSSSMSMLWSRNGNAVQNTFAVHPVYLVSENSDLPAFRHWGIQLSRRSLCLKVWFVMRIYGLEGMQKQIRQLVRCAEVFRDLIEEDGRFMIIGKPMLTLFAFNVKAESLGESNRLTKELCEYINRSSKLFVTHARPGGTDVIRVNTSHALSLEDDVHESYRVLSELTTEYLESNAEFSSFKYQGDMMTDIKGNQSLATLSDTTQHSGGRSLSRARFSSSAHSPRASPSENNNNSTHKPLNPED